MVELKDIKNVLEKSTIAVASSDKNGNPHNIVVMYAKVSDNKIIISDVFMKTTLKNIKENPKISLVFWQGEAGFGINGKVEYHNSGKWLEFVKNLPENKEMNPKGALVISIDKIRRLGN